MSDPTVVLVTGCPRSGTTVMSSILNSHPSVTITNEINLAKFVADAEALLSRRWLKASRTRQRSRTTREAWHYSDVLASIPDMDAIKPLVKQLLVDYCKTTKIGTDSRTTVIGDKLPGYSSEALNRLSHYISKIKIINVTRDPVSTVKSMMARRANFLRGKDGWVSAPIYPEYGLNVWVRAWNERERFGLLKNCELLDLNFNAITSAENQEQLGVLLADFLEVENRFQISLTPLAAACMQELKGLAFNTRIPDALVEISESWGGECMYLNGNDAVNGCEIPLVDIPFQRKLAARLIGLLGH